MFYGCTVLPDSKETELENSNQEAYPLPGKNTEVALVPCLCMEVCLYSYFQWWRYLWAPWVSFITTDEGQINYFKDLCLMNSEPTLLILGYLNIMNYGHIIKNM